MLKNDLKNDIEKTLQAHCPEPPEGFAERMDNKAISLIQKKHNQNVNKGRSRFRLPVLVTAAMLALCFVTAATRDLINRPDEIRARETTTPLVTTLSEGKGEVTEGAGLSQEAIKTLEETYPGLINELKPVNLSNEQQGVRFDLVSAVIKNRDFYIVYSIQDLEGDRVKANLSTDYHDHFGANDHPQEIMRLNYDEAEHKGEYVRKYTMPEAIHTTGEVVAMSFQDLWTSEHCCTVDLLPLLEQYGKTVKSVALPEDLNIQLYDPGDTSANYSSVLDYTQPLDITLYGPVKLTGIGWIDNKLHVQVYNQDTSVINIGRNSSPSWKIWLGSHITDQEGNRFVDYNTLSWGYSDEKEPVWQEYVWDISPDEKSQMDLSVAVEHVTKTLEAKWEFQVPADSILAGTGAETAAREEKQAGAGLSQEAIEALETNFPGVADKLKPVNLSCEKQGIRMNVISALVEENEYWAVYGIKDLEGDRINTYHFPMPSDNLEEESSGSEGAHFYSTPEYGEIYLTHRAFSKPVLSEEDTLVLSIKDIALGWQDQLDLIPLLEQYGNTSEGVAPPQILPIIKAGKVYFDEDIQKAGVKILDNSDPLDVELSENVSLSGIGWIGDQLHVQVRCKENETYKLTRSPGKYGYDRYTVWVMNYPGKGGYSLNDELSPLRWGVSDATSEAAEWNEFVFNSTPADVERMNLQIRISEVTGVVEDNWEVRIPVDMIRVEAGEEPAANIQNESDEQIKATLWAFFSSWVGQNTEYMLDVCADEWKKDRLDPKQAIQKIMGYWGQPGGYKINGISGKDNDPVRTVDLTVQWKTEDGGYSYNRHEIAFRLQQVTPAMEAYRIDPVGFNTGIDVETVPGKELVLLTEEEIIRKEVGYQDLSYDDFIPLNLSVEKQGIQMKVVSGCVKGQDLYVLCSFQDLEGRYDGLDMELVQWYRDEFPRMDYSRPYSNYAENKSFWLFHTEQFAQYQAEDGTIALAIDLVKFENDTSVDLIPFLEKYGKKSDGVNAPENARSFADGESTEGLKVLDYTNPLDVSLAETATLTGIGWIDNQLHVQMHTGAETIQTKSGTGFSATQVHAYDPISSLSSQVVEWDDSGDWFPEWYDYALDIKPEEVEQRWLVAEVREVKGTVEDNWEIQVPVNKLLKETGEEPAAAVNTGNEYELEENVSKCLWWFFRDWVLGNTDNVAGTFEHDWNTDRTDPEKSAKEIMKSGIPGGFKIHSVSERDGDLNYKVDVSVLWQEGADTYRCTRHELEFWLRKGENGSLEYAINPEGFRTGSAVESFPDNPVLVREEEIIRDVMDVHVEDVSYDELLPISLSTEKQGIRMDVVSGCRKGDIAYLLLTVQDLNGKYSEYEYNPQFVSVAEDDFGGSHCERLIINRAERKTTWLYRIDLSKTLPTENNTFRAGIKQLRFSERKEIDLLPMLKEYGRVQEGVTPPKESLHLTLDGKPKENKMKALNYEESLDIHLDGNIFLSAIGWIDDQLHVQFQEKSWEMMQQEYPGDNYAIIANCHVKDKAYEEIHVEDSPMSWLRAEDVTSWEECVFNCTPEDQDRMELYATETISRGVLNDDWTVEVPMEMIRGETREETTAQETDEAEPATLSNEGEVFLEYAYPGLLNELKPVNLSSVQQGIRADVISALIKDQKLYVVYSLQDLEGDRIKDNLNTYTYYLDNLGGTGLYSMRLGQDETEEHKVTFLKVYDIPDPVQTDGKLVVNLIGLMTEEYTTIDLLPLLKKYGKTVEGIEKPEDIVAETMDWSTMSFSNVDLSKYPTILDYSQPLDITLEGPVSLTGIGWIDNRLHVQIYNPDETTVTMGDTTYLSWMSSSRLAITDREDSRNPEYDILSWDASSGRQMAWKKYAEYVWEITPDDMDHLELKADINHYQKISDTTWKIEIPVASILEETDKDTATQETAAPSI